MSGERIRYALMSLHIWHYLAGAQQCVPRRHYVVNIKTSAKNSGRLRRSTP
jgi:hypothetical protein